MKNKFLIIFYFISFLTYSQAPQGTSYQGVSRDKKGEPIVNKKIALKVYILNGSENGEPEYIESFSDTNSPANSILTDEFGSYNLIIGKGHSEKNKFSDIKWATGNKYIKIEEDNENNGKGLNYFLVGYTQLMSVPYALFAQNTQSISNSFTVVDNLNDLRHLDCSTGTAYMRGYNTPGDGGGGIFIWVPNFDSISENRYIENYKSCKEINFCDTDNSFIENNDGDNGGTIIKSYNQHCTGKWIRQYENLINIKFFGVMSTGGDYSCEIQKAIDFAEINTRTNPFLKGSSIFFPNGSYFISNKITLKDGVSLTGESIGSTILYATGDCFKNDDNLFEIEEGPVMVNLSNFTMIGRDLNASKNLNCFNFVAKNNNITNNNNNDPLTHGGLWNSTIKNIIIKQFTGDCIILDGGGGDINYNYLIPNQFTIFENVRAFRNNSIRSSLHINGQAGQLSFLNCQFDGFTKNQSKYANNSNVIISSKHYQTGNVISFINSTFQDSDIGVLLKYSDGITFDTCWFENLGISIMVEGTEFPSNGINILNNRFANAAGFGSKKVDSSNISRGMCISVKNGLINVENNVVTTSENNELIIDDYFVFAEKDNFGANLNNNSFRWKVLGKTYGILQYIEIDNQEVLNCKNNRLVFVKNSGTIKYIESGINAGERISIRAENGPIKFSRFGNLFLINTYPFTSGDFVTLNQGEMAVFVKIDNSDMNGLNLYETYQLESIIRVTTPQN